MANHGAVSETKSTYDVFLSFRGEDTRHTFTHNLYDALCRKEIMTFMDDEELKLGDQLGPTLLKAIEESRISIVVFSENYADSSWCLDELVKIHECMKSKNQLVWPIFYKVEPSDVRHQNGSYRNATTKHETRFGKDSKKVHKWRSTLTDIANLKGEHLKLEQGRDQSKFIDDLVSKIFIKVSPKDLSNDEHIVGREYRVKELKSLLDLESHNITCLLGIHGTGGIGKTTLSKALYDSIYKKFNGSCFLFNVKETSNLINGLENLQQRLLSEILEDSKIEVKSKEQGAKIIKKSLHSKRVLIVLDDVDNIEQLENLAKECDWFGPGSRIIITTRDTHSLDLCEVQKRYNYVKRYNVKNLNDQESLELFCQSAFRKSYPESNYGCLSNRAMRCCKGLPLALKVLGSHLVGKDLGGWKDALDRYEKSPHPSVQGVLRISYDSLPSEEKNIFLDVACFFKGKKLIYIKTVLDACNFSSGDGITTLVDKSLLTVDDNDCLGMHDMIQAMGREIVKEEAWNDVGERSRLWHHDDVFQVLADNNGSNKIQGIMLEPPQDQEINCIDTVFEKMKNLRILIVRNTNFSQGLRYLPNNLMVLDWLKCPSQSFPSYFYPRKIGYLCLVSCPQLVLEKPFIESFENLTLMCFACCDMVTKFPDVSGAKNLRTMVLDGCSNLVSIHESVGHLANLVSLSASACRQLESFVPTMYLPSLEFLSFERCRRLAHFPEIEGTMNKPLVIRMSDTAIKELPQSFKKLTGLIYLDMTQSRIAELQEIPEVPSSAQKVYGRECKSLTSETFDILCSQVRKEMKGLEIITQKGEIPEWFHCVKKGGFPVFKARGKFPGVALAFVFGELKPNKFIPWPAVDMHLFVEGEDRGFGVSVVEENQALLCDLQGLFKLEEWEDVGVGIGNDWKTIEVYCKSADFTLCSWGVYVYKQHETNMENIDFTSQIPKSSLEFAAILRESIGEIEDEETDPWLEDLTKYEYKQHVTNKEDTVKFTSQLPRSSLESGRALLPWRINSPTEGEGTSRLNIEDQEDEDIDSWSEEIAKRTSDDGKRKMFDKHPIYYVTPRKREKKSHSC